MLSTDTLGIGLFVQYELEIGQIVTALWKWVTSNHFCPVSSFLGYLVQTTAQLHSSQHTSKKMLKFIPARLQQYMNHELPDVQTGFGKGRGTRDQSSTSTGSLKKKESSRKTSTSALLTMPKPLTVWITTSYGNFLRRWEYQTPWPTSWEICMQVKKQQLELDMEQRTGSKSVKEYVKAIYCQPAYLTYMQSTSWEMPGRMKHKLESRLPGEISIISDMQMTPPSWQKAKKN